MDPNEALLQLRDWATRVLAPHQGDVYSLDEMNRAEQFQSLDQWLSKGGFLPDDWSSR